MFGEECFIYRAIINPMVINREQSPVLIYGNNAVFTKLALFIKDILVCRCQTACIGVISVSPNVIIVVKSIV